MRASTGCTCRPINSGCFNGDEVAILATSPGGIAEMSLTAKALHLGVPIVTAFHVARMVVLVLAIGPLFRLLQRP